MSRIESYNWDGFYYIKAKDIALLASQVGAK